MEHARMSQCLRRLVLTAYRRAWSKLAFRARGVLIAVSIPITHSTPFNQHRLTLCRPYFFTRLMDVDDLAHDLGDWFAVGPLCSTICAGLPSRRRAKLGSKAWARARQRGNYNNISPTLRRLAFAKLIAKILPPALRRFLVPTTSL
jgi:hypothetical protein